MVDFLFYLDYDQSVRVFMYFLTLKHTGCSEFLKISTNKHNISQKYENNIVV